MEWSRVTAAERGVNEKKNFDFPIPFSPHPVDLKGFTGLFSFSPEKKKHLQSV